MAASSRVTITQRKSSAGANGKVRDTLRSLGLGGIGRTVERPDGPQLRGMVRTVRHLVDVTDSGSGGRPAAKETGENG